VPKRKSPSTQVVSGESAEAKAPSGQSTKLGKTERNAAFLRLSLGTYSCAQVASGKVTAVAAARMLATTFCRAAWRQRSTRSFQLCARVVFDQRDTKTPRSLGKRVATRSAAGRQKLNESRRFQAICRNAPDDRFHLEIAEDFRFGLEQRTDNSTKIRTM
jgi:hypothetical protein